MKVLNLFLYDLHGYSSNYIVFLRQKKFENIIDLKTDIKHAIIFTIT